jgi:hypothetical protein
MDSVSVTKQTRLQVERAQRAAEEARQRVQAGKSWSPYKDPEGEPEEAPKQRRGEFLQYFSGD